MNDPKSILQGIADFANALTGIKPSELAENPAKASEMAERILKLGMEFKEQYKPTDPNSLKVDPEFFTKLNNEVLSSTVLLLVDSLYKYTSKFVLLTQVEDMLKSLGKPDGDTQLNDLLDRAIRGDQKKAASDEE